MIEPVLLSERFGALGNVVSEGIWNQLGRPELDRLALLLRESVQNSWDARTSDSIDFWIESSRLTREQVTAYGSFFGRTPAQEAYLRPGDLTESITTIPNWLDSKSPRVFVVSDRGTRGLDGPTRADRDALEGDERNFVDFLRNVGQPPTKSHGGGTFGYGKAAFYLASETRTIVVYTRCRHRGVHEERLTAAALTHHFAHAGLRYTGRHWWGHVIDGAAEPLLDENARQWARTLGLPSFDEADCGTTIAIVAPVFSDESLRELPALCLRHLWPKLRATDRGRPPISLRLKVSGHELAVPDPSSTAPYDAYFRALRRIRAGDAEELTYNRKVTGRIAFEHAFVPGSSALTDESQSLVPEHEVRPRHIALLRTPELVVKYLDGGRSIATDGVGFAGVFLADPNEDRAFALAEPPSHDDWQPATVRDDRARGVVSLALKRMRAAARDFATPKAADIGTSGGASLAKLSNEFADLLPGLRIGGEPVARDSGPSSGAGAAKRARGARPLARVHEASDFVEIEGAGCAVFRVDVAHANGSEKTLLRADVYTVLGGGTREAEPPRNAATPRVRWWESPRGARTEGDSVVVGARQQGTWTIVVAIPVREPTVVGLEVYASSEKAS